MITSTIAGPATTYNDTQDGKLIARSNALSAMVDILPGATSPDVLDAGAVIHVHNDDLVGLLAVTVGAGAMLDGAAHGFVVIGPGQAASFHSDGTNYRSLIKPNFAKLGYGQTNTFYIDQLGSDNNCGLTPTTAFKSLTAAWNFAAFNVHLNSGSVFFQLADSTTPYPGLVCNGFHLGYGYGQVLFRGNNTDPSKVTVSNGGNGCFLASNGASIYVEGMTLDGGAGNALETNWSALIFAKDVIFTACSGSHIQAITNGYVEMNGTYWVNGGAACHVATGSGGNVPIGGGVLFLGGTPHFGSAFFNAQDRSKISCSMPYSGNATGVQYIGADNSMIFNSSPNAVPGNVPGYVTSGAVFH